MLNESNTIFLQGAVIGIYFFMTLLLGFESYFDAFRIRRQRITPPMRLLGITLLMDSLSVFLGPILRTFNHELIWLKGVSDTLDVIIAFFYCLTAYSLLVGKYPSRKITTIVFCPIPIILILYFILGGEYSYYCLAAIATSIFHFVYLIYASLHYDKLLLYRYSNLENRSTTWIAYYVYAILVGFPSYMALNVLTTGKPYADFLYFVGITIMLMLLTRRIFLQEYTYQQATEEEERTLETLEEEEEERKKSSDINMPPAPVHYDEEKAEEMKYQLQILMEDKQIYTNADLSMYDIVKYFNTNSTYLYYFMRDVMHTKFYDYVNGYRIKHAKRMLGSTNEKIETIALASGFNSYNTFVHAFKKTTGKSPNQYRKEKAN